MDIDQLHDITTELVKLHDDPRLTRRRRRQINRCLDDLVCINWALHLIKGRRIREALREA